MESRCNGGGAINKRNKLVFVAVAGPRCRSPRSCLGARDQILAVSVDGERRIHVWSRSCCQRLSKHFRAGKLFLSQKARRPESQKACYGGILYVFLPPRSLCTGERFSARPDDNTGNLTRDSLLPQPSYIPDLLPLYCWGLLQGFLSHIEQLTSSSRRFLRHTWKERARFMSPQQRACLRREAKGDCGC